MANKVNYWVACSGGVDSVVLCHLLHAQGIAFGILHCNFQLRGAASDEDAVFVEKLAQQLDVPFYKKCFETEKFAAENGLNTQLAARELRYAWFAAFIQQEGGFVLLGQHYDDQMETFFLQLRRGAGVKGLSGMPFKREIYLRPLLKYTKQELVDLAQKKGWTWREDRSNQLNEYKRNWYRNEVLDILKENGFPLGKVVPLMEDFQLVLRFLQALPLANAFAIADWLSFPIWWQQFVLDAHGLGEFSAKEVGRLAQGKKGKFLGSKKHQVWNEGDALVFIERTTKGKAKRLKEVCLPIAEVVFQKGNIYLDAAKEKGPLHLDYWRAGDKFTPLGMKGVKAMGKFLRDRKVPAHQKNEVLTLRNEQQEIVGVFNFGISEHFKVDEATKLVRVVSIDE